MTSVHHSPESRNQNDAVFSEKDIKPQTTHQNLRSQWSLSGSIWTVWLWSSCLKPGLISENQDLLSVVEYKVQEGFLGGSGRFGKVLDEFYKGLDGSGRFSDSSHLPKFDSVLLVSFLQGSNVMVKENFLFLLPVDGIEPRVTTVTNAKLLKGGSAENNKENGRIQDSPRHRYSQYRRHRYSWYR